MKISAFTFIRNGQILGYPFIQSIESVLPIVDEFVINVGPCEDDTLEQIQAIDDPKIRCIQSTWNECMQEKGFVYGQQKMIAQYNCSGDWAFYVEADEVMHEDDHQILLDCIQKYHDDPRVEAIAFDYLHFYANEKSVLDSPRWYRSEVRIIRNTIRSIAPDGLFWTVMEGNKKYRYPRAVQSGAKIYHYGWVRSEEQMSLKSEKVNRYWKSAPEKIDYNEIDPDIIREFKGTHPAVMAGWLPRSDCVFRAKPVNGVPNDYLRYRKKAWLEKKINIDLSKKHYKLIK